MISIFAYTDYKTFMRAKISEDKSRKWGQVSRIAAAAGCQQSFISQVLKGKHQLQPEHLHGLALYWKLNRQERLYFSNLLEHARSGSAQHREYLRAELARQRRENEDLGERIQFPRVDTKQQEILYYANWLPVAVHILVSIAKYQSVAAISARLQVPTVLVEQTLQQLSQMGFVKEKNGHWAFHGSSVYLHKDSPLRRLNHANWRDRALIDCQNPNSDGVHFTNVQSMSIEAFAQIKQNLLNFIDTSSKIASPSREEEVFCLAANFFRI